MARKAIVNKDVILDMLKEGKTTQFIAEKYGVSRQAIDLHRKDFIGKGLLPDQRAARTKRVQKENTTVARRSGLTREPAFVKHDTISLDEHIELVISAFSALKRLPELETELETYKCRYKDAMQEIERFEQAVKKRDEQERRWALAQGNKDSITPGTSDNNEPQH
ncbi:hypothetical protein ACFLTO_06420 [Chloroflexota bacterium]